MTYQPFHFQQAYLGHKSGVYDLVRKGSTDHFFSADGNGWIVEWTVGDAEKGNLLAKVRGPIFSLHYIDALNLLFAGNLHGELFCFDLSSGVQLIHQLNLGSAIFDIDHLNDQLYIATKKGALLRYRYFGSELLLQSTIAISQQSLRRIQISNNETEIFIASSDNYLYCLDLENEIILYQIKAHDNSVFCLALHPNNSSIYTGGRDAQLNEYDITEKVVQRNLQIAAHNFTINDLALIASKGLLITASRDKSIKIWDTNDKLKLLQVINKEKTEAHLNSVNCLLYFEKENMLFSGGDDRSILAWKAE